jgi:peptide/nickel transport system substrate-binding protein
VKRSSFTVLIGSAVLALALAAAGCGGGGGEKKKSEGGKGGGTLVFGTSSDPIALDGALVADGESLRAIAQIYETLVTLKPGSTELEPRLATSWDASPDGKTYTFHLRKGVKFHDGTPFNAEAVCFNYDRWFNFKGSFQNGDASYYYQTVFGGFKQNEPGSDLGESLYKSCQAKDENTAVITLTKPSAPFISATTLQAFSIASPTALKTYKADEGKVDSEGTFKPTGTFATKHPIGTGPFKFDTWVRGDRLVMVRNETYWGSKAKLDKLIFRPVPDPAAQLQALQSGEIQGFDLVAPEDISTIESDQNLKILDRPAFNVGYVGINQAKPPMDKLAVRQAVAYGLDRKQVVNSFYAGRGNVAKEFMPPVIEGYAEDVKTYEYNPAKAKQLLQSAGVTLPLKVDFWYPAKVSRPYMPEPKRNYEAFAASLEKSGFKVVPHTALWDTGAYANATDNGKAQLYLLGWTADYGDADNFLGIFFQTPQKAWGFKNEQIFSLLDKAEAETDEAKRVSLYKQANGIIMDFLPGVPYVHTKPALAFQKNVNGYVPNPTSLEYFTNVTVS